MKFEIDHDLALGCAREYKRLGHPRWWFAWTIWNLRWLCHECHARKTAADRVDLQGKRVEKESKIASSQGAEMINRKATAQQKAYINDLVVQLMELGGDTEYYANVGSDPDLGLTEASELINGLKSDIAEYRQAEREGY